MLRLRLIYLLSIVVLHLSTAQRRVLDGKTLTNDRRYVVYMIKANASVLYDAWMCGGAIVSPLYIVTSAACVEDVKHMYAIAGYTKYVKYDDLNHDQCTANTKKKVVYVCLPSEYNFDYPRVEQWANIDIALVKVESSYDFADSSYRSHCSYTPTLIEINYDPKLQEPGTNALVFGWGHTKKWRSVEDHRDYNANDILYGAVKLANKEECKKYFDDDKIKNVIDKYMICSMDEGNLNDSGGLMKDIHNDPNSFKSNCAPGTLRMGDEPIYVPLLSTGLLSSDESDSSPQAGPVWIEDFTYMFEFLRRCILTMFSFTENLTCIADYSYRRNNANESIADARRRGICQNDHGGPLVSWRGPREVLIGIASVFRVQDSTKACIPPFLYTSTHCNGAFLNCLMNEQTRLSSHIVHYELTRRCDALAKRGGFNIIRRSISWALHPDGPAQNEIPSVTGQSPDEALRNTKDESDNTDIRMRSIVRFEHLGGQ